MRTGDTTDARGCSTGECAPSWYQRPSNRAGAARGFGPYSKVCKAGHDGSAGAKVAKPWSPSGFEETLPAKRPRWEPISRSKRLAVQPNAGAIGARRPCRGPGAHSSSCSPGKRRMRSPRDAAPAVVMPLPFRLTDRSRSRCSERRQSLSDECAYEGISAAASRIGTPPRTRT